MEFGAGLPHGDDADFRRQYGIERSSKRACSPAVRRVERYFLGRRVHAGVRPPRGGDPHRRIEQARQRRLYCSLYGRDDWLELPAGEWSPIILDGATDTSRPIQYFRITPTTIPCTWTRDALRTRGLRVGFAGCSRIRPPDSR